MRVIGTAGHVDHGKSTLVQALTGIHPDRLKEEREREMTIDLGFAWLTLPNGEEVGIVDVPGHRDFIENMLAGVGSIDAALFVVAADEGVMPQTREHLAILDLLQIQGGIVALTKSDLIDDAEWLDLIETDVREVLEGTVLAEAPIVRVSALSGEGIAELKSALMECLAERPPRPDLHRPRLAIDRVFTISGFGTIVTGTLLDGRLAIGEELEILPRGLRGRVRGLQTHKRKEDIAVPGSRTAVNISGVALDEIQRGEVIAHPGDYRSTRRLDAYFRLLPDASLPLRHNTEVKLFIGAAEILARLRLLGVDELSPGSSGWIQLEPIEPVIAVRGDRYILRRPSPGETIGGGAIIDPHPKRRHKRFAEDILQRLESLRQGTPEDILLQAILALGATTPREAYDRANLGTDQAQTALRTLLDAGAILVPDSSQSENETLPALNDLIIPVGLWTSLADEAVTEVSNYLQINPLRKGMPREELKSRLRSLARVPSKTATRLFNAVLRQLASQSRLEEVGPLVLIPGHRIVFTPAQQTAVNRLLTRFAAAPFAPPSIKESQAEVGEDVFTALLELGELVAVTQEVVFRKEDYEKMVREIRQQLESRGVITAAEVRDHFNTSRKYVLGLLEHLDQIGITQRDGDVRRLRR